MTALRLLVACVLVFAAGTGAAQQSSSSELRIHGATITIDCECSRGPTLDILRPWVQDAADAIQTYYGRFPVKQFRIAVTATDGRGVQSGTTYTWASPLIRVSVGRDSSAADLKRDWVMTHEMVHLTQRELDERFAWVQEGLAVYVEPIARAQVGQLSEEKVWGDMVRDMPKGLPVAGDRGLDNTNTWGRTYWGGAMFFLLADVQIRERTANRLGLQDALRGIVTAGGSRLPVGDIGQMFAIGDDATGTTVLSDLYREMRDAPIAPDLAVLWQRLGVDRRAGQVVFDDSAALAGIRRAITRRPTL